MGFSVVNRLQGLRVYLAGAMDRVPDRGTGWRDKITPFLNDLNVVVFDPLKKPGSIGIENQETHDVKNHLKKVGDYNELSKIMKTIRSVDLRMVDISDFLIVHLDINTHPCGTFEEIFLANRQKKPIIVHIEQGKSHCPDWLFGAMPHELFFDTWDQILRYLAKINTEQHIDTLNNRWCFLNA